MVRAIRPLTGLGSPIPKGYNMPTYDYECDACDHKFEEFQSMMDEPLKKCPKCGKKKLRRLLAQGRRSSSRVRAFTRRITAANRTRVPPRPRRRRPAPSRENARATVRAIHPPDPENPLARTRPRPNPGEKTRSLRPENPMMRVRCPVCHCWMQGQGLKDWPSWPFCSSRCKLIDLGRWLGGVYRLG